MLLSLFTIATLSFQLLLAKANPIPHQSPLSLQFMNDRNEKRFYDYGTIKSPIRGVNIGGWLVLEPYITPSLFERFRENPFNDDGIPVDEFHYCKYLGYDEAKSRLINHWDTFYTEQDFKDIADKGLNLVRIPIGYWAFKKRDLDPFVTGYQEKYLDNAIEWSKKYGLKVWVDLHGAAGSQNGFDNSGLRDHLEFLNDDNLDVTLQALKYILEKYSREEFLDTVVGIELINEPLGGVIDMQKYKTQFLDVAYDYLRHTLKRNQIIVIHDTFLPNEYWDDFWTLKQDHWGVVIDHHRYEAFNYGDLTSPIEMKVRTACAWGLSSIKDTHWSITGEFSAALTDCTKWLNGVGRGARYDGTLASNYAPIGSCKPFNDISQYTPEMRTNTRKFVEAQLDAFEMREGWIIWCYKTESSIEWDLKRLIEYDLFPQPITSRKYPKQCE
ncbi:hypothetical protein TBLA_0A09860 [Henningerozyma blattae CBS 6284]|uniref:glucan 1,3-beta-glucosidase n=1 Tax=Henningerozyma blattae (strain ATCC 34711 / CBS 6284 / DSM 70876 / NBRC 10599 / NRRL Y-10934 / UCD 77-7) TaxID=1071380 RepID=I2GXB7_HENB6|nr:hypothetical protein TBLA_0A09860 [Tetrapisispora blattae CBS 6284]CCH58769.1 hypothetical protein TBLA_0A09860 [Tetrapisispora blattae CBS 6284]